MSQNMEVLNYMKSMGSISTYESFRVLGVTRLASRIHDLREMGYKINADKVMGNKDGKRKMWCEYSLAKEDSEEQ